MWMQPVWDWLEAEVFPLPSSGGDRPLFNFYLDEHPSLDRPAAARLRRENLRRSLERFSQPPRWLAVGEAPGWRGGRFSGAPFTSEALLLSGRLGYLGTPQPAGLNRPYAEASATIFWQSLPADQNWIGSRPGLELPARSTRTSPGTPAPTAAPLRQRLTHTCRY